MQNGRRKRGFDSMNSGIPMPLPSGKRVILVATNKDLADEHYYRRLWITMRNLSDMYDISRRQWVSLSIATFRDASESLELRWPNGMPYVPPDWGVCFKDGDARWFSYYLEEGCNGSPKRRFKLFSRLRVFDAVIRVRWPHIAKRIRE